MKVIKFVVHYTDILEYVNEGGHEITIALAIPTSEIEDEIMILYDWLAAIYLVINSINPYYIYVVAGGVSMADRHQMLSCYHDILLNMIVLHSFLLA
jgi:hypothetical protein